MKYLFAVIVCVLTLAAGGYEAIWRAGNSDLSDSVISPDGRYMARFFSLPEASAVPYGSGAYVRYRYLPFWSTSTLVFGGYCGRNERLYWRSSRELVIECATVEGTPKLFPAPDGIVVTHHDR